MTPTTNDDPNALPDAGNGNSSRRPNMLISDDELGDLWASIDEMIAQESDPAKGALVAEFHRHLESIVSPESAFFMLPGYDANELILDGQFTLEQLKGIVEAWEQFRSMVPPEQT